MKLSVCIAVYNEEEHIHYALDSVVSFADEIVIVDGGSEDRTIEIALSYGPKVRIIRTDNPPMFHINKQKSLDAANGDWILQLDADEAVPNELREEIISLISASDNPDSVNEPPVAYWLPRKNYFLGRFLMKGGQYPDYTMRFYRKGSVRFPCKSVHENVETIDPKASTGYLNAALLHYADADFSRYLMRWNRYTTLDAKILFEKGESACAPCYLFGKPVATFFLMYIRHLGVLDGVPGFIFALFSSIRYWAIYAKLYGLRHTSTRV